MVRPAVRVQSVLSFVVLLAAGSMAAGCPRAAPYRIAVVLDEDGLRGAALAAADINAAGGIDGHVLELRSMPGGGSTKARVALETAAEIVLDPSILAVVGHTSSSATLAASPVYTADGIVQIAPTSTTPLYGGSPYSFRLAASDVHQGVFLAEQVLGRTPRARVAIVFVNDDYGQPLGEVVRKRLRAGGLSPVYDAPYSEDDTLTVHEIVRALSRRRPTMLVIIGRSGEYRSMQPALRNALPDLEVIASDGFGGPLLADDPLRLLRDVRYVRLVDLQRADSSLTRFRSIYLHAGSGEPSDQAVLSYDAVSLLAEAIRRSGPSRKGVRDWLSRVGRESRAFPGLSGAIAFDSAGTRRPQYFLERVGAPSVAP